MMPLAMSRAGDELMVARVGGNEEAKKHLEDLGFVAGAHITIISPAGGRQHYRECEGVPACNHKSDGFQSDGCTADVSLREDNMKEEWKK